MLKEIEYKLRKNPAKLSNPYQFKQAAVLLPLIQYQNTIHLLFEIRADKLNFQPNEICFPGGKIDSTDRSPKTAMLRELQEELGIRPHQLHLISQLDYFSSHLGYIIYPFCGQIITLMHHIQPNPAEVANIFTVPLDWFIQHPPEIQQLTLGSQFKAKPIIENAIQSQNWRSHTEVPIFFYSYQDKIIWGLTAEIIHQFILKITAE